MKGFKDTSQKEKEKQKQYFVKQKVTELLGRVSPFLYGTTASRVWFDYCLTFASLAQSHCRNSLLSEIPL